MKVSAKATSKYLSKADIAVPLIAIMDVVRTETLQNPTEQKDVLHFVGEQIKPLVLNVTNKRVIIAAYGDESDDWRGKPLDIYVNHDVTNSSGQVVGGVRVRIPALAAPPTRHAAGTQNGKTPKTSPPSGPPLTIPEKHRIVLDGFAAARTVEKVHEFAAWAKNQDFTPDQDDEQSDAFHSAMERIARTPARRPVPARA
jgi:hypothetical protein